MDRRDHPEPSLATMRTLLDIDAGQALHERWRRFDGLEGWRRQLQEGLTAPETLGAIPVAQHAVMANADEARNAVHCITH